MIEQVATAGVRVGDRGMIGIDEGTLVRGASAASATPILFMLGFALLGEAVVVPGLDRPTLILGALGSGAGLLWLRRYNRRAAGDRHFQPVIPHKDRDDVLPCTASRQFNS
jgi:positive regulator of sigma E activity